MLVFDEQLSTTVERPDSARPRREPRPDGPLADELLDRMQRYWQAANYLTVGQIYLRENPLLQRSLTPSDVKPRLLGHWGTLPGQNFIYVHANRLIRDTSAHCIYISGPGHGGPALNAQSYLEGTYTAVHPEVTQDAAGMRVLFRQFSTPGGVGSHCGPHVPNSMHEGGELGYSLLHAFGAAFDNPELIVVCVVGDGEAETAPLDGSWKGVKFLNPARDGAVLPILHVNGYKIAGPTVDGRTHDDQLRMLFRGRGYEPHFVEGDDPVAMHQQLAATLNACYARIRDIQHDARTNGVDGAPVWPMIVFRSPKGWTGPVEVDGVPIAGTFRAHQVPLANVLEEPEHLRLLEEWLRSYHPETLFDRDGHLLPELAALVPPPALRMGASPHVNGGRVLVDLDVPAFVDYALDVPEPGRVAAEAPRALGQFLRDIIVRNPTNFRLLSPDETNSNRLNAVFEATTRCSMEPTVSIDDHVSPDGRVMEVLSEHCCEGWLEGYVLTGRHGVWASYEAFAQIVDSMFTQHGKWLEEALKYRWRKPVASLNVFLSSHAWRNEHNGFSHQAPGFVDNALARRSEVVRIYYPPDANCLLSVMDHCLRSRNYVNVVTCGKQLQLQWLCMDDAIAHCTRGALRWGFASNDSEDEPDVVLACTGDVPTLEVCAASWLLQKHVPGLRVRVVNIVDLGTIMHPDLHPHGMGDLAFEELFTPDAPVIFAYHGYRWAIHSMVHGRANEARFHVRGFRERGTTTTPFDMVVLNGMSRLQLALDALHYARRVDSDPSLRDAAERAAAYFDERLRTHATYIREHLEDMPEITNWQWTADFTDSTEPAPLATAQQPHAALFSDA